MTTLPPVEKLPLALRKNVRDEWENKKPQLKKELSDVLNTAWTVELNPNQLFAYATDSFAKESLGSCIAAYVSGATRRLKEFADDYGSDGVGEINTICHAHVLTMDLDVAKKFSYCGTDVQDGRLRIVFAQGYLGTNVDYALDRAVLMQALNEAPSNEKQALSFAARCDIRKEYDAKIEEVRSKIAKMLWKEDIKLNPNFEETFERLTTESKVKKTSLRSDWQGQLGYMTRLYWEGLVNRLGEQKFEDDGMLREGFHEAVPSGQIKFRVVEGLKYDSYCEVVVEDGVLYLQCMPSTWGTNVDYAALKLVDQL